MQQLKPRVTAAERVALAPERILLKSRDQETGHVLLAQQSRPPNEHSLPALPDHALLLVLGQPVRMFQHRDGRRDERYMQSGDLLLTPAGMETSCRWDSTLHMVRLQIPQPVLTRVAAELDVLNPERLELINQFQMRDPQIEQIILALQAESQSDDPGTRLSIESLTNLLLIWLLRNYSNLPPRENRVVGTLERPFLHRVTDYINDNLSADLALGEIAAVAGMSPYHFGRRFKRAMGTTPHQYVIRQRVERAKYLLLSTDLPVSEIADAVGFYDQGHLSRHMRSLLGVSPNALRQSQRTR